MDRRLVGDGPDKMGETIGAMADIEPIESRHQLRAQPPSNHDLEPFGWHSASLPLIEQLGFRQRHAKLIAAERRPS